MLKARRREVLKNSLTAMLASTAPIASSAASASASSGAGVDLASASWSSVRQQFQLDDSVIHMACFLLASHPHSVAQAIERHRQLLDRNPAEYLMGSEHELELKVLEAAANYINEKAENIALIQSTTEGLATLYNGIRIGEGQEVLTTEHDHYATFKSLEFSTARNKASIKRIALYDQRNPTTATAAAIVSRVEKAISSKTRVIALTWVHSSSGIKLPIHEISKVVATANKGRAESDRILLCVDGVHGFGIENIDVQHMGCDFFIAGTHKWMFGPRGTGILWGKDSAWSQVEPTIPTFDFGAFLQWMKFMPQSPIPGAIRMTPGGTHAFEHRWAMNEAFEFHQNIGKLRVANRIHALNSMLKEEMLKMEGVHLKTPVSAELSAGITAFEIDGLSPANSIKTFRKYDIVASQSPYAISYTRLSPGIINNEQDVEKCLAAVRDIARS